MVTIRQKRLYKSIIFVLLINGRNWWSGCELLSTCDALSQMRKTLLEISKSRKTVALLSSHKARPPLSWEALREAVKDKRFDATFNKRTGLACKFDKECDDSIVSLVRFGFRGKEPGLIISAEKGVAATVVSCCNNSWHDICTKIALSAQRIWWSSNYLASFLLHQIFISYKITVFWKQHHSKPSSPSCSTYKFTRESFLDKCFHLTNDEMLWTACGNCKSVTHSNAFRYNISLDLCVQSQ